jgi:hypothetical protein
MAAVRSRRFVGREEELAALRGAASRAREGAPAVIVVAGEPGIGKSRLVAEFVAGLRADGEVVATGHGVDLAGGALPYGAVAGLVRDLRASIGTDRIIDILGSRGRGARYSARWTPRSPRPVRITRTVTGCSRRSSISSSD